MNFFIKSGNISIRPILLKDKQKFMSWHNDEILRKEIGGIFPFECKTFIDICQNYCQNDNPSNIWFSICEKDELIGIAGLHNIKYIQSNAEIGILIGEKVNCGSGIGSVVLQCIEKYAFCNLGLHRIYAYVYQDNLCSQRFFQKNNWGKEGVLKEAMYWDSAYKDIFIFAKINKKIKEGRHNEKI